MSVAGTRLVFVVLLMIVVVSEARGQALFEGEPSDAHVRQGELGTCYLHGLLAAVARMRPGWIKGSISPVPGLGLLGMESYRVSLAFNREETVFRSDALESRKQGYDRSVGGLWTAVILRAYGQSILRENLQLFIRNQGVLDPMVKDLAVAWLDKDPLVIPAYDRAVRSVVSQSGDVDARQLVDAIRREARILPIPEEVLDALLGVAVQAGFIAELEKLVKTNPEIFGAWKVIGDGGIVSVAARRLYGLQCETFRGDSLSEADLLEKLIAGTKAKKIMVASGRDTCAEKDPEWFTDRHAFAILSASSEGIELRNPWASTPDPVRVSVSAVRRCFSGFRVCSP